MCHGMFGRGPSSDGGSESNRSTPRYNAILTARGRHHSVPTQQQAAVSYEEKECPKVDCQDSKTRDSAITDDLMLPSGAEASFSLLRQTGLEMDEFLFPSTFVKGGADGNGGVRRPRLGVVSSGMAVGQLSSFASSSCDSSTNLFADGEDTARTAFPFVEPQSNDGSILCVGSFEQKR